MKERGFTIIEVIVTITVVSTLVYLLSNLLSSTLKGSSKAQLLGIIKQNGQQALDLIADTIRSSDEVVCVRLDSGVNSTAGSGKIITVFNQGRYISFQINPEISVASGRITQLTRVVTSATEPIDNAGLLALCDPPQGMNVDWIRTGFLTGSGVSVKDGQFTVIKSAGAKNTVQIQFDLAPAVGAGSGYENQLGGSGVLRFQTTVQLR